MSVLRSRIKMAIICGVGRLREPVAHRGPELLIVIYHRVGSGTDTAIDVGVSTFSAHLDYLQANYDIVSMDQAAGAIERGGLRTDSAVLSFDDGYWDFYANALPILVRRGLPSILYVATQYVDSGLCFPWDARFSGPEWRSVRPLTWQEIREIARVGLVTVASHGHSHRRFDRLTPAELERELKLADKLIHLNVGRAASHLACPKGIYSKNLSLIASRYARTVTVGGWRPNRDGDIDLNRLQRVPAMPTSDARLFAWSLRGAGWPIGLLAGLRDHFSQQ